MQQSKNFESDYISIKRLQMFLNQVNSLNGGKIVTQLPTPTDT